ncbi:hypothetical protein ABFS83_04G169800 [Erythranthe nasuta]
MAVANAWATGHAVVPPPPQLRPVFPSSQETCPLSKKCSRITFPSKYILRRSNKSTYSCHCSSNNNTSYPATCSSSSSSSSADWDWDRWTRHFSEVEEADSFASLLKFQLEDAIEKEDFREASKLKKAMDETTSKDSIAEILYQLKNAIDDERYHDASRLCRSTGSGLIGWWVGYSKSSDDPFGRLIRITPETGRFVGRSYNPRQLVTSSPGTPLFEIFLVKDTDDTYKMQVVFLKKIKRNQENSDSPSSATSATGVENGSLVDSEVGEIEEEKNQETSLDLEEATEEGIKSVISFLKEKIPELKVKVTNVNLTEDITIDTLKQLIGDDNNNNNNNSTINDDIEEEVSDSDNSDGIEDENNYEKIYVGDVLHNEEENNTKDEFVRVPANIKDMERDSFVLHIPKSDEDNRSEESVVKADAIKAIRDVSELIRPEIAKAFGSSEKVSAKISRNMREIIKLAVTQAQKHNRLSEYTNFRRVTTSKGDMDTFEGLYVGAFGPYGTEVVQLKRKYGNWNVNNDEKSSDVEFFEYVEAVKLTGDLNVPAGEVTFRAKIGKANRLANRGLYPDELGVVASYRGQGRIAEFGFKNPKWVEGELLQLNGKGMGQYVEGADLGFLYVVPEQSFLVLFDRLKLPE